MKIKSIHSFLDSGTKWGSNTFVITFENNDCLIVDPSYLNKRLIKYIEENDLKLLGVLITHGHFDHIQGLPVLLNKYRNLPIYVSENDVCLLRDKNLNLSGLSKDKREHLEISVPVKAVIEGPLNIGEHSLEVIETPFHTEGSIIFYFKNDNVAFTGDTLMKESIGRFDLPHAAPRRTKESLIKLSDRLPDETIIYPGHEAITNMKYERENNRFLIRFMESKK